MPNFDTGHYFLTLLSPIKQGTTADGISYAQNLRMLLTALRTAHQSPATEGDDVSAQDNSPFVLSQRTHICRFVVLDDVVFNGRVQRNALLTKLTMKLMKRFQGAEATNPLLEPQDVDRLNCAYLMFTAEIDASRRPEDALPQTLTLEQQDEVRDTYARELWETMPEAIHEIYKNCEGFAPTSAEDCMRYMQRCQVETTLPFNDYWLEPPELPGLPGKILLPLLLLPLGVTLLALLSWLLQLDKVLLLGWLLGLSSGWTLLIGSALTAAAFYGVYRYILANGNKPMPAGRYADLPSVLKALYTQQHFAQFAIEMQGKSDEELYEQFGQFIAKHKPDDKMSPSQAPGVIASKTANGGEQA